MTNLDNYNKVFTESFEVSPDGLNGLKYQDIEAWDSVGHMGLIAALEETFNIELSADDIVEFSSYEKGKEILSKYGISL